jgi:SAM-dependent methyltransferase
MASPSNALLQRRHHLIRAEASSKSRYVLQLLHLKAYEEARDRADGLAVLDWGCNAGYGLEILTERASRVAGLDVAEHAVEASRRLRPELSDDIRLMQAGKAPFADDEFDVVCSFQVLEHVEDYGAYLGEIARVLRPGGCALLTTPNAALRLDPGMPPWNPFHRREFHPAELGPFLARWFGQVEVLGLFGTDRIERCERRRLEWARREARLRGRLGPLRPLYDVVNQTRRGLRRMVERRVPERLQYWRRYDTAELCWQKDRLERALDLLAVCRP